VSQNFRAVGDAEARPRDRKMNEEWIPMGKFLAAFSLLALSISLALAQSPEALLSKTFKAYQSLSGLRVRSTIVAEQKLGEASMKRTISHEATYQRPNLLRVKWIEENGQGGITVVSDGKNLFTQIDALKQVKKEAAPKTLKEIVRSSDRQSLVVDELSCFIGESWKDKVTAAKIVGKETLNKRSTTKIQLSLKDGSTQSLWVDEKGFIWQSQRKLEQDHPGGKITLTITETFSEVTANPKLPKDFFAYKMPPGYKQVSEFQNPQMPPRQQR
jgi:outer membrane lipoprotein-sorting protein